MRETRGERIEREAWQRGDVRRRCEQGHLSCTRCAVCACDNDLVDIVEFPSGRVRISTDKQGRTICRECRYQEDEMGNY